MAFTTRAKRGYFGDSAATATPSDVGPGAYLGPSKYRTKHSYAPFLSTAPKTSAADNDETFRTPGPGAYQVEARARDKQYASSAAFADSTDRFGRGKVVRGLGTANHSTPAEAPELPGPGSYDLPDQWNKPRAGVPPPQQAAAGSNGKPKVKWVRVGTAPSIPAQNQSHGYDEDDTGDLVLQKPPNRDPTGGPAYYNPQDSFKKERVRGGDFSKSKSKRIPFVARDTPAPGQYELAQDLAKRASGGGATTAAGGMLVAAGSPTAKDGRHTLPKRRPAAFASTVSRDKASKVAQAAMPIETPGPGAYNAPSAFKPRAVQEDLQFFGSTAPRQLHPESKLKTPGPGAYSDRRSAFAKKTTGRGAFDSTAPRFSEPMGGKRRARQQDPPGPGSYNIDAKPTVAAPRGSRRGAFGSTTERFSMAKPEVVEAAAPGPGAYDVDAKPRGRRYKKPTASFHSKTTRDIHHLREEDGGPPPGSYDVAPKWTSSRPTYARPGVGFGVSKRFQEPSQSKATGATPGPGQYNADVPARTQKFSRAGALLGTEPRFKERREYVPGPGSYQPEDPNSGFVKRTFNITINDTY